MVFEHLEGCVRERKKYQTIIKSDSKIYQQRHHQTMKHMTIFVSIKKVYPNRRMERPMVEKELRISRRSVRCAAEASLNEIKNQRTTASGGR